MAQESRLGPWLIARLAGVSENTMRDYFDLYAAGGLDKLKEVNLYRPTSALEAHTAGGVLPRRSAGDDQRSPTRDRNVDWHQAQRDAGAHLPEKKLHLRCRKVGMIPAKANPEQQAVYLHQELEPRLAEAQLGNARFSLSMRPISSWRLFWVFSGRWCGYHPSASRAPTLQCPGRLECGHARTHYSDQ